MKLSFLVLFLVFTSFSYTQDSEDSVDPVMQDYTPVDRPAIDYDEMPVEQDSSEVNTYDYDY